MGKEGWINYSQQTIIRVELLFYSLVMNDLDKCAGEWKSIENMLKLPVEKILRMWDTLAELKLVVSALEKL